MATTAVTELSLARRFNTIAKDYANRPVVARRNTVPTLLRFLTNGDREVRRLACETIFFLCDHPENPDFLCHEKGFVQGVFEAYKETEGTDPELHNFLDAAFGKLRVAIPDAQGDGDGDASISIADGESARIAKSRTTRVQKTAQTCRSLEISVSNLGAESVAELEEVFHTTRGVISFTIDLESKSAKLYMSTATLTLLKIMADSGFRAEVVSEVEVARGSVPQNSGNGAAASTSAAPGYLSSIKSLASGLRNTLVVHGVENNTLSMRMKRMKEEEMREKNKQEKSAITNFMSKLTAGWW
jgi:hypothetical protein